ncbi:MAG TPA: hypothetical protein GX708_22610 [Gallicola sp.]|nr:hypothetical protein [Gallicola sp.]
MLKKKDKKRLIVLGVGLSLIPIGYFKYREKLRQINLNESILNNQESMIDEIIYHEEVIEKLGDSISKLKYKILKNRDEGIE